MRRALGGMLIAVALAATGCGGGDGGGDDTTASPTTAQFAQAFKAQRTALDAIGNDISSTIGAAQQQSDAALAGQFGALAERADAALVGLRGLEPTAAATTKLATLRAAVTDGARELHAIAAAAGRHDAKGAEAATRRLGMAGERIEAAERALSRALGLPPSPSTPATPKTDGRITVTYAPPATNADRVARQVLQLGGTDGVAAGFTKRFELPVDLHIAVVTGDVGPHYDPQTHTVTISYGFVDQIAGILRKGLPDITQYELGRELASIDGFILVHELGHAFVDVFELPITGREEDAVDGLATVFLVDYVKNGDEYAFFAARFFKLLSEMRGVDASSFYDEHSLDAQRAYDIVCTIAGSGEAAFNQVRRLRILPPRRLARCPSEYQQKTRAWKALLAPHLR